MPLDKKFLYMTKNNQHGRFLQKNENFDALRLQQSSRLLVLVPDSNSFLIKKFFILVCLVKIGKLTEPLLVESVERSLSLSIRYNQLFTEDKDVFFLVILKEDLQKLEAVAIDVFYKEYPNLNLELKKMASGDTETAFLIALLAELKWVDPEL
jgi:hypothetical protein